MERTKHGKYSSIRAGTHTKSHEMKAVRDQVILHTWVEKGNREDFLEWWTADNKLWRLADRNSTHNC